MAQSRRRLFFTVVILNLICRSLVLSDLNQRSFVDDEDEALVVRKERQVNSAGFNSLVNVVDFFLKGYVVTSPNASVSNYTTVSITPAFWTTFFNILQYITFVLWFGGIMMSYVVGVLILFLFAIVSPGSTDHISNNFFNGALFRSFEDENMPLFDKVTSVGYGFLDRSSELYNLLHTPACLRYSMCHLSSTLGDQEANGFVFKDLFRSISSALDNKGGTEGMSRSVNVGLLTGDCDEPIMSCPELAPYFKKVSDTWSNYL